VNKVETTLKERQSNYGDFSENARIAQELKSVVQHAPGWILQCNQVQREAIEMILFKISRIVTGNPHYKDNWHDIQGYAKLAEERCDDK
jgi:hypothetical protein